MTQEEFMADPWSAVVLNAQGIQAEWFRLLWESPTYFKEYVLSELSRSFSKSGDFQHPHIISVIGRSLDDARFSEFYKAILQRSGRSETEVRQTFAAVFPNRIDAIPGIDQSLVIEEYTGAIINAVVHNSAADIAEILGWLTDSGIDPTSITIATDDLAYFSPAHKDIDISPLGSRCTILQLAQFFGSTKVIPLLGGNP